MAGDGRFICRLETLQHMTGGGRLHALRTEQVLHANRHARQRQQLVLRPRLVSSVSGGKRMIRRFNDEGIERLGGGNIRIECVGHVRSEEHTSELQPLMRISYAVLCLKKKNT